MTGFQVLGWPYFSQPNFCHTKVQQATFGGIGLVTETAHVEDDARRAAGFALGVEQQVAKQLEEAKRQAHEEVRLIFFRGGLGGFIHMCQGLNAFFWGDGHPPFTRESKKRVCKPVLLDALPQETNGGFRPQHMY